ncbi:hypothetical protein KJ657_03145 [Patescibacteria group bacterium]|nr:hypothetical protein [Patescibacteria group bacterium]MBU1016060.1 hypothetical protein [Patescibacteria group bacterium]MBU1938678.1 hypothetical protein [Patescibacteria group bacterium]
MSADFAMAGGEASGTLTAGVRDAAHPVPKAGKRQAIAKNKGIAFIFPYPFFRLVVNEQAGL